MLKSNSEKIDRCQIVIRIPVEYRDRLYVWLWANDPTAARPGINRFVMNAIDGLPELDLDENQRKEFESWQSRNIAKFQQKGKRRK